MTRAGIALAVLISAASAAEAGRRHAKASPAAKTVSARDCLARAMYFESDRTSRDGMLAVGTVVANRLEDGRYGSSVCDVVGSHMQFAPGVLRRPLAERAPAALAREMADAVLAGRRHPGAADALYFHTANVPFRRGDKRYVLVAGGNLFYDFNKSGSKAENAASLERVMASAEADRRATRAIVAGLDPAPPVSSAIVLPSPPPATILRAAATAQAAGPRVIRPAAPALASLGPTFPATAPAFALDPRPAPQPSIVVAQATGPYRN